MKSILLTHAARYPLWEPTDAVKLIYQNEFGGGHLIRDENACLTFLKKEYASITQDHHAPLLEDIGNGLFRVNLAALDAHHICPEELGQWFIHSSSIHRGSLDSFRQKLTALIVLTAEGKMPFPLSALQDYLSDYERDGFPPVSHSKIYRNTYHPAYRVVRSDCLPDTVKQQMS